MNAIPLAVIAAMARAPAHGATVEEIRAAAAAENVEGAGLPSLKRLLSRLVNRGLAERRRGRWLATTAGLAVLAAASGAPLSRDDLRQRLWRALRWLKKATAADLVALAARGPEKAPLANARSYLRALCRAGYATPLKRRDPGGRKIWLLTRDTGPRAPAFNDQAGALADRNIGEVHRV